MKYKTLEEGIGSLTESEKKQLQRTIQQCQDLQSQIETIKEESKGVIENHNRALDNLQGSTEKLDQVTTYIKQTFETYKAAKNTNRKTNQNPFLN